MSFEKYNNKSQFDMLFILVMKLTFMKNIIYK